MDKAVGCYAYGDIVLDAQTQNGDESFQPRRVRVSSSSSS